MARGRGEAGALELEVEDMVLFHHFGSIIHKLRLFVNEMLVCGEERREESSRKGAKGAKRRRGDRMNKMNEMNGMGREQNSREGAKAQRGQGEGKGRGWT